MQHQVHHHHNRCHNHRIQHLGQGAQNTDGRRGPNGSGSGQPANVGAVPQNQAGAQKAHTADHLGSHTGQVRVVLVDHKGKRRVGIRPHTHDHIGKYTRLVLGPLALQAYKKAQNNGQRQSNGKPGQRRNIHQMRIAFHFKLSLRFLFCLLGRFLF